MTYYSTFYPVESAAGSKGSAAFLGAISTAIVYLYRRSATALVDADKPNGSVIFTFATANTNVTAVTNSWTTTIPAGTDPIYVVAATATGTGATDTIATGEWSTPQILAQNGISGMNSATVFLFKRATTNSAPAVPTQTSTYTFSSGVLIGTSSAGNTTSPFLNGWSQTSPDSSAGKYLFVTTATAISSGTTDTILTTEWAAPTLLTQDGQAGYTAYLTNENHTLPAANDGTVSAYTGATGQFKVYLDGIGDISSSFTLSTVSNPQTLTIGYASQTYTVTAGFDPGEDTATVTIRATGSGAYSAVTIDKVFTLGKSKTGATSKSIDIASDRQIISYDGAGALSPTSQTVSLSVTKQNTSNTVTWTLADTKGNALTASTYLSSDLAGTTGANTGDTIYLTAAKFQSAISVNGAQGVVATATVTDTVTLVDKVTIMKVQNGAAGSAGSPGTNAVSIKVTKKQISVAAYADGSVGSFSGSNGILTVWDGTTDVTAAASISATGSGCTGTINTVANSPVSGQPKGYYEVTAASADASTLTLTAVYSGQTVTEVVSVSKIKGGYEIVGTLPSTNLFAGRIVFLTTDKKLYKYETTPTAQWVLLVNAADLSGQIVNGQIAAGAVTGSKLGLGTGGNLLVGAVPGYNARNYINFSWNPDSIPFYNSDTGSTATSGQSIIQSPNFTLWPAGAGWIMPDASNFAIYQPNATTGAYNVVDFCPTRLTDVSGNSSMLYPVEPGKTYEFTIYTAAHRCKIEVFMVWVMADQSTQIGEAGTRHVNDQPTQATQGGKELTNYVRQWNRGTAPSNARYVFCVIRKYCTASGSDSWFFGTRPMLCETVPNASELVPYSVPALALVNADNIVANSIKVGKLAANSIVADNITAGSIKASHLIIANTVDVFPDPGFYDKSWWDPTYSFSDATTFLYGQDETSATNAPLRSIVAGVGTVDRLSRQVLIEPGIYLRARLRVFISSTATGWWGGSIHLPSQAWWVPFPYNTRSDVDSSGYPLIDMATTTIPRNSWQTYEVVTQFHPGIGFAGNQNYLQQRTRFNLTAGFVAYAWEVTRAIDSNLIVDGTITANEIAAGAVTAAKISVTQLDSISATIGLLRTATTGARTEIQDNQIRVYDSSNVMRVRLGVW